MIPLTTIPDFKMWYEPLLFIDDVEVHFNEGVRVCMKDVSNALLVLTHLNVPITNTCSAAVCLEQLKTVKGSVDVFFDNNKLIFKNGNTKYKVTTLCDPKVVTAVFPEIKWELFKINIPKDGIKDLMNVAEKEETMKFKTLDGNLYVVDEEDLVEVTYDNVVDKSLEIKSGFGFSYIGPIIKSLKYFNNLEVFLGNAVPAKFHMWNDLMDIVYLVAPRIED